MRKYVIYILQYEYYAQENVFYYMILSFQERLPKRKSIVVLQKNYPKIAIEDWELSNIIQHLIFSDDIHQSTNGSIS
jgi:hypothetical protein